MKGTSAPMLLELSGSSRLAKCFKIVPHFGETLTLTEHDDYIIDPVDDLPYAPLPGGSESDVSSDVQLNADNVDLAGASEYPYPTMSSIRAGDWDYAYVEMFYLCWADPSKGRHFLRVGNLGELSTKLSNFKSEFRGLLQYLSQSIGSVTQPNCRHRFGDGEVGSWGCNKDGLTDPDEHSVEGIVTYVNAEGDNMEITNLASGSPPVPGDGYRFGKILALDGLNAGRIAEIKGSTNLGILLHLPFPYVITIGTAVRVYQGCDLSRATCKNRFNNINNFDGEPWLPGTDKIVQVAREDD